MSEIILQAPLLEEIKQVAVEQNVELSHILDEAVHTYLRQLERNKIKAEVEAFHSMHSELLQSYEGEYVAIHNGKVVDHDASLQPLHNRIRQRFGRQTVLLRQVSTEPERVLSFRSPSFERGQP